MEGDGGRFLGYPGYYFPVERIFLLVSHRQSCNVSDDCRDAAGERKALVWFSQSNSVGGIRY